MQESRSEDLLSFYTTKGLIKMKDTRIMEKQATELIKKNERMVFRYLLANGNMVERIIKPVKPNPKSFTVYRDIRKFYRPKKGKIEDIRTVNTSSLKKLESVEMPSKSEDGNTIKSLIVSLLDMGYVVVGGE